MLSLDEVMQLALVNRDPLVFIMMTRFESIGGKRAVRGTNVLPMGMGNCRISAEKAVEIITLSVHSAST